MLGRSLGWVVLGGAIACVALAVLAAPGAAQITGYNNAGTNALTVANALVEAAPPGLVTGAQFVQYPTGAAVPVGVSNGMISTIFGVPEGNQIIIMSSGRSTDLFPGAQGGWSGTPSTSWGTSSYHGARDVSVLRIDLNLPPGHDCITFDFQFMSEEYPTWMPQGPYRDGFVAEMDQHTWMMAGSNMNAPNNFATVPAVIGSNTPYVNAALTLTPPLAQPTRVEGGTQVYTATGFASPPGGPHSLYLSSYDAVDTIVDSMTLVDNLRSFAGHCSPTPPTAGYLWVQPDPCYPIIQFTDISLPFAGDVITDWLWDFGDGGTSTLANPAHSFSGPGPWTVSLTVTDDDFEQDTYVLPDVVLCVPPVPQFSYRVVSPCDTHDPYIQFIDESYDPDEDGYVIGVHWNFGFGEYSYEHDPYHTWGDLPGQFPVTLTALDNFGTIASITVTIPFSGFVHCPMAAGDSQIPGSDPLNPADGHNATIGAHENDGDGVAAEADNCPGFSNADQGDVDLDGFGDACDQDADGDGRGNDADNCWLLLNVDQTDLDEDGRGDACDLDVDGDDVLDALDVCPGLADSQADADANGVGDACDTLTTTGDETVPLAGSAGQQRESSGGLSPVKAIRSIPMSALIAAAVGLVVLLGVIGVAVVRTR